MSVRAAWNEVKSFMQLASRGMATPTLNQPCITNTYPFPNLSLPLAHTHFRVLIGCIFVLPVSYDVINIWYSHSPLSDSTSQNPDVYNSPNFLLYNAMYN